MTNKEWIQSMNDDEMTMFLQLGIDEWFLDANENDDYVESIKKWLHSEYKPTIQTRNIFTGETIIL